jgi:hypothetical protein
MKQLCSVRQGLLWDPQWQKQMDARTAKLAVRRMAMQRLRRTPAQHSDVLARSSKLRVAALCMQSGLSGAPARGAAALSGVETRVATSQALPGCPGTRTLNPGLWTAACVRACVHARMRVSVCLDDRLGLPVSPSDLCWWWAGPTPSSSGGRPEGSSTAATTAAAGRSAAARRVCCALMKCRSPIPSLPPRSRVCAPSLSPLSHR